MYERWGMTEAEAARISGVDAVTEQELVDAELEIVDALGWEPDPASWQTSSTTYTAAGRAFGRAVAYQAAWRQAHPATAGDVDAGKLSETFPDYGYTRDRPQLPAGLRLADRTVALLRRWGFVRASGSSTPAPSEPDLWRPLGSEV